MPTTPHVSSPQPQAVGQLRLLCLFHLNLAFSSLEEESHAEVIRRCYRPALELARDTGFPIALEATGWTLRRIAQLDPGWIELLRELLDEGSAELVGSAHAQCAAPLLPALLNAWNLRLGREVYQELLGVAPRIALVCEQVYAPGLVPLYLEAGYEALIVDWDNARRSHPQWPAEHRLHPQRALGGGRSIPIVWSKSIAFQKFQRFAHGELSLERYLDYVRGVDVDADSDAGAVATAGRALMLYANDVEIFDHRPGRFAAEPQLQEGEWARIAAGLRTMREQGIGIPALPSEVLDLLDAPGAGYELQLEAPAQPIPVKKQDKYNVSRWAVTGRDDIGINTRCWRLYERLRSEGCADRERWRELCELWASDFRTHITDARWSAFLSRLEDVERRWLPRRSADPEPLWRSADPEPLRESMEPLAGIVSGARDSSASPQARAPGGGAVSGEDSLELRAGSLTLRLNTRRGMAIEAFSDTRICERPLLGTLEHGYFPAIELGADFYSGHLVQESPLTHKLTDLERVQPEVGLDGRGRLCALARIATELGPIEKAIRLDPDGGAVELEWALHWGELPLGSLRLGHMTLLPEAFAAQTLWYATHNGGAELETHRIGGAGFDHGAAVSALVTCRQGLGVTEGVVLLGDAERAIRVEIDHTSALPLGLVTWIPGVERWFLRLCFSLTESDETRRGGIPRDPGDPQRMRMRIAAEHTRSGSAE
jgi:Glycosyl hydrolase family 57